ncbi:hypothetical protein Psi01_81640 [Planobispora siamensis]|uniref:Uncharacterized protein n=1 Tax=Planobispora siamensis TaxID=936338 RepID=A0A8J3WNK9_9ACTN|nr:hypothetical protein Psi01_81640 [Planobispora siamensis]
MAARTHRSAPGGVLTGVTASRPDRPGPLRAGAMVERGARFLGRGFTCRYLVTACEPDHICMLSAGHRRSGSGARHSGGRLNQPSSRASGKPVISATPAGVIVSTMRP